MEIKEEKGYRIADIQAVSGTILLDQKKSNRVFQKKVQTYMGIASTVTADTEHSACILPGSDMRTGGTLIQYQETDWRFLKRMASQLGLPLVPDTSYYYPRFYLGLPEGEKRELGEIISCDLCFDGRYYAVSGKCLVDREDFICYDVVTRTSLSLGDRVTYEGRELHVSQKKTELAGGEVIFTYRLAGNSYTWVPWEDNPDYTGMSFVGSIVGTQGEQVEVAFDIDKSAAGGNRYGFAPATGNLMYCMPQKGTKTALYIGNGDEAQGIATGCIRTNGSTCEGTTIESNGGLVLMAKEGIRLESMTGIAMQGMSDIMALYSEGASSFCVNGSVDMLGRRTSLAGTVYQGYNPFEDVPQKGEFDWGGFARNLVMGLAVGAACIALAVFLPGIGTVAAGALFGAGMGAISASVAGAVSDYSSGNVRSLGEATKDMVISMITGAITGAIGAAFPAMKWFGEGLIDVGSGILTRGMYALLNPDMSTEEKLAYVFDLKQMGVDFITGVAMHFAFKGVSAVREKLPWNKGGSYSVGDATFMDSDDSFFRYIQKRADVDANGYYDIIAHGTPNGIQITHNGQHMIVDHRTAARLIQNADGYNGQGIRLLSCNTGALDDGFAQNLANQLNVEVYAPTNYLWATQDGNYFVAGMTNQKGPNMSELGIFKLFIPGGSQ